jgi:aspartyl-tRNA(Asn)/glutamyl-tRNA(Gln) amidotransferase subunit C
MSVTPEEVLRMATLAELSVDPADLPALTAQMDRIVSFVAQLSALPEDGQIDAGQVGPATTPLREDEVRPSGLTRSAQEMAPVFVDGFFVVPRLEAMDQP